MKELFPEKTGVSTSVKVIGSSQKGVGYFLSSGAVATSVTNSAANLGTPHESKKNTTTFSQPNTHSAGKSGTTGN